MQKKALYFHAVGPRLVPAPVLVTEEGALLCPESGKVLVTGAVLSEVPVNGGYVLDEPPAPVEKKPRKKKAAATDGADKTDGADDADGSEDEGADNADEGQSATEV